MYIKKTLRYEIIKNVACHIDFWWLTIKVYYNRQFLYITGVYRAPGYLTVNSEFFKHFNSCMDELSEINEKVIILGDFNVNWFSDVSPKRILKDVIQDCGYKQIINEFTRITLETKSLIDYVIVNDFYNIRANCEKILKISDHETIIVSINHNFKEENNIESIRTLKYSADKFRNKIIRSDIMTVYFLNCDIKAELFSGSFKNIINELMVVKNIKLNKNEWYNFELRKLKNLKINQYKIACLLDTSNDWCKYKSIRNLFKKKINEAKNKYISDKIDYATDQKSMWQSIKNFVLNKPKAEIKEVIFNNIKFTDNIEIANKFNNYFVNSVAQINQGIPVQLYQNRIPSIHNIKFKFKKLTYTELRILINSLKNKKDMNNANVKMIKDSFDLIGENLLSIINKSMESGVFPEVWKESLVIPIEKIRNTKKCEEFRPINMIAIEAKILEKVVHIQLEKHMEEHNLISKYQSGFRKKHSCEALINLLIANWKMAVYDKKVIVAVFIDLRRAFETVDRKILLHKLESYGIGDVELTWFRSYLTGRKQRTRINSVVSDAIEVLLGVPQGTILGVLLFLVYINDMEKAITFSKLLLFADDGLVYYIGENAEECFEKISFDIDKLCIWFQMNKLKINIDKTKCLIINGRIGNNSLKIDNETLQFVNEIKYLGVVIDDKLDFKSHVDYICKKIAKKIHFFSCIRKKLSVLSSIKVFNTMIKPHFEYCSSILFMCNAEMLCRLQKLHNRGMRIILKLNRFSSKRRMLNTLNWLSVNQRIKMNVLIMVFKIKMKLMPNYLSERLVYAGDIHNYPLRDTHNFRLNFVRNNKTQNMLFYNGLKLFNDMPLTIKSEKNFNLFKRKVINYVKIKF